MVYILSAGVFSYVVNPDLRLERPEREAFGHLVGPHRSYLEHCLQVSNAVLCEALPRESSYVVFQSHSWPYARDSVLGS